MKAQNAGFERPTLDNAAGDSQTRFFFGFQGYYGNGGRLSRGRNPN